MRAWSLREVRRRLGDPPRHIHPRERRVRRPTWLDERDPLASLVKEQDRLFMEGSVLWACFVQANQVLFEPGRQACPADVLYGTSPELEDQPSALREISSLLFGLRGTSPQDPGAKEMAALLNDETGRPMHYRIPPSLTGELELYMTTIMVYPHQLPFSCISGQVFPLIVHRDLVNAMIVPCAFWSERLLLEWSAPLETPRERI